MRSRSSIVLLGLLMTLAVLIFAAPDFLAQAAESGATEDTTLEVDSVGSGALHYTDRHPPLTKIYYNLVPFSAQEFKIHGSGFVEGSKVEFRQTLANGTIFILTVNPSKITFVNSTLLCVNAPYNLWLSDKGNFISGIWYARITNPNGDSASTNSGLTVAHNDPSLKEFSMTDEERERDQEEGVREDEEIEEEKGYTDLFSPNCVIATSAYGSDLAPEVQFLREFRDEKVLSTFAGSSFMNAFDSFYYPWSPTVADSIRDDETAKAFTRGMIVPLLGVLSVSSSVYYLLLFSPELSVTLTGLMASSMLGAIYLTLPMIVVVKLVSRSVGRVKIRKGITVLVSLSAIGFVITSLAVYAGSSAFAMFGSATLVLSSMFATALIVSLLVLAIARPILLRIHSK